MNGYLTAALAVALLAAVVFCRLWRTETHAADQYAGQLKQERAHRRDVERQLTAATDALLTDLNSLPTTEDFR